ncbi:hypothetical protein ABW19_dt0205313 [Dactylella cylindrospora]|nr:hypothetical protein ABW19_dt0205313 [Dactylella cylindrospora]
MASAPTELPSQGEAATTTQTAFPTHLESTSNDDDDSYFDNLGIPKANNWPPKSETTEPTTLPNQETPIAPPTDAHDTHIPTPAPNVSIHHSETPDSGQMQPTALPRLDSDNLISTCHVEDITVGCLKCQAKSAERLAAGEVTNWETIHQQHILESEDDSEGLEMPVRKPSDAGLVATAPTNEVEDVPDTKDIGFTPGPFDGLGVTEDPFEKLKQDSISHTSSFPAVPEPKTAGADAPSNPFGDDTAADDSFFDNVGKQEKPVEPSDSNFFGDDSGARDDFLAMVGGSNPPTLERSETADLVMGGSANPETEDNKFTEGLPLFSGQDASEDDFFARSRTPLDPSMIDDDASFFDNPEALKRKSTAIAAGIPDLHSPTTEDNAAAKPPQADLASQWKAALDDDDFLEEEEEEEAKTAEQKPAAAPQSAWFDDGEGFLSDDDEGKSPAPPTQTGVPPVQPAAAPTASRYTPSNITPQPYTPAYANTATTPNTAASHFTPAASPFATAFHQPPKPAEVAKAESFVDKTSNYHSPYDLPDDIVKPIKKKPHPVQQPPPYAQGQVYGTHGSLSTPQSAQSMFSPGPPSSGLAPSAEIRGRTGFGGQQGPPHGPPSRTGASPAPGVLPQKALKPQSSGFFEELPVTIPKRSTSSTSGRYTPGARAPSGGAPLGHPPTSAPISMNRTPSYGGPPSRPTSVEPGFPSPPVGSLGVPHPYGTSPIPGASPLARSASPYAAPPTSSTSHYTPKPASNAGLYASPPSTIRGTSPYAPRPGPSGVPARSSSVSSESRYAPAPSHEAVGLGLSGTPEHMTNGYAPSGHAPPSHPPSGRPPSRDRPGTMESMKGHALGGVAEEDEEGNAPAPSAFEKALPPPPVAASNRYVSNNKQPTPPPGSQSALSRLASPPPRNQSPGKYTPAAYQTHTSNSSLSSSVLSPTDTTGFAPPKRSQTQSPGFAAFRTTNMSGIQRPSSAAATHAMGYNAYSPVDARRQSYPVQATHPPQPPQLFMAPPPGSLAASDPLERWKGTPLFCWGFGGSVVTMFPVHTNRWNAETGQQMVKTSLGEVKIRPAKDALKEDDIFEDAAKFPGPVFGGRAGGKGRKKEISTWMEAKILRLEGEYTRYRDPRSMEKVILWKIVKLCLENDGMLGGKPEIDAAVRQIIHPEADTAELPPPKNALQQSTVYDRNALDAIRTHLLKGDREAAVWFAIENKQWAHAILVASTTSPELYKRTVQEFVRQEVKSVDGVQRPGMESMAVLYEVFAGNWEESIDDLVPASTRMGMKMMSTTGNNSNGNALEGLEKWRETLGLMLSNRSNNDIEAIAKLGSLLESYNRIEAAHVCYLFAMPAAMFSGAEESSKSIFTLLGANHVNNPFNYGRDLDAIILSEIYEFALSLLPGAPTLTTLPHLLPFKLHHANILAQYGFKAEAQKYADAIAASFKYTGRPQPYVHQLFLSNLDELTKQLSQAPRDSNTGSWMSKPTLDNISGSLLSKFNKFVTGDDEGEKDKAAAGGGTNGSIGGGINGEAEGPFAKLAGTPDLSRAQSGIDLYGGSVGGYTPYNTAQPPLGTSPASMVKPMGAVASRYAPKAQGGGGYVPQQAVPTKPTEPATPAYGGYGGYEPQSTHSYGGYGGYEPSPQPTPYHPAETASENSNGYVGYQPSPALTSAPMMSPPSFDTGYSTFTPPTISTAPATEPQSVSQSTGFEPPSSGGYEPPSSGGYGYEPPTSEFQPYNPSPDNSDDESGKKKKPKKSIMDDDGDDFGTSKAAGQGASDSAEEARKKREKEEEENRKMVAAIAEKEKKAAEEAQKAKSGGGWFGGWFGGKKDPNGPVVHKAKLGEDNSFVYDPDLKKWVNKKAGATDSSSATPSGTPPPPKRIGSPAVSAPPSAPPSGPGTPRPGTSSSMDSSGFGGPPRPPPSAPPTSAPTSAPSGGLMPPPAPGSASSREPSPNRPPPRPATTGKVDEMEELLGSGGSVRKGTAKAKGRKRYVEVL